MCRPVQAAGDLQSLINAASQSQSLQQIHSDISLSRLVVKIQQSYKSISLPQSRALVRLAGRGYFFIGMADRRRERLAVNAGACLHVAGSRHEGVKGGALI